jgi:uncharacterized surface protein with fasciclin (FAS1) repeats
VISHRSVQRAPSAPIKKEIQTMFRQFAPMLFVPALFIVGCSHEPAAMSPDDASSVEAPPSATADIVQTASEAGSFKTLIAAVQAAGLEDTLKSPVESLLKPENKDKLKAILTYHVVSGKVMASEAVKLSSAKTVNGKELTLDASSGKLVVNGATVTQADIAASNGVIHVIDAVVLPE